MLQRVLATPAAQSIGLRLEKGRGFSIDGVSRGAQAFVTLLLRRLSPQRTIVVVTEGVKSQELFQQDLETWINQVNPPALVANKLPGEKPEERSEAQREPKPEPARPLFFPAWEVATHEGRLPHADVISERLETLVQLAARSAPSKRGAPAPIVVTTASALMQRTFTPGYLRDRIRTVRRGERIDPLDLVEWLEAQGYEPEAQVTQKGELALRGGILDVYPLTSPWPVRLEFFGDEVESMRFFDPMTQISREQVETAVFGPAGEIGVLKRLIESKDAENAAGSLLDYLESSAVLVCCEPELIEEHADAYQDTVPADDPFLLPWPDVLARADRRKMSVIELREAKPEPPILGVDSATLDSSGEGAAESEGCCLIEFTPLETYRPIPERAPDPQVAEVQRREFFHQLHRWLRQGYHVHVFCNNPGERDRFSEIWKEYGLDVPIAKLETGTAEVAAPRTARKGRKRAGGEADSSRTPADPPPHVGGYETREISGPSVTPLSVEIGSLSQGFVLDAAQCVVVTDAEIFGRYRVQRPRRLRSPHAAASRSALDIDFTDLQEGDYVVHLQHGIGRYRGLQSLPAGLGRRKESAAPAAAGPECLVIEYAAGDSDQAAPKLYVPVTEAHLVSKYVGTGKARPALNTLGGTRWAKAKAQAECAVRDLAGELLSMQAARESQQGHAFVPDTPWQREFESAFLYEETPDQMRAILETKKDMESTRPMDRLICGDVGYGKTEVAIRAAFKAVMDGRQVAVLVPTTILAQQHFNTFRERMADYPVRVEQLSRFRTRAEQRRILEQLGDGSVDIVIGTHRLLQEDVGFKDLGLVVVDEEQRFGVMHKEKLKLLRHLVDVLTLSATPIPRTLYLALTGARDMSTIETPPQDRLPVETIVTAYDERVIRDAIQRELNREGQVYFLHNRVDDIQNVAVRIQALVPTARILVGHGQMNSDELEEIMTGFINGEADVLVSTTIIESGIDIPNANTIIIDRADRFGLSDLYQLRGRVGRYKHQAYAYLMIPRHASLLSDVRKRINAIKQYSSLGSGFKIAMRDLEIRGAGNLLGPQQSGHITAVGFELYCQLLKQSVSALKGEKVKPRIEVVLRLDFLAMDPAEEKQPSREPATPKPRGRSKASPEPEISVPREVGTYYDDAGDVEPEEIPIPIPIERAPAYIPFGYVSEPRQRIEIYRKLAQADDKVALQALGAELLDRFGRLPPAAELLLQAAELKLLAAEKNIHLVESKDQKLILMRNSDYIMIGGKFPRLTRKDVKGRLGEIKRLLLAL